MRSPEGLLLTIEVTGDEQCFSGTTPLGVAQCTTGNNTLDLPGNGNLAVAGVVYAPSDNIQINGDKTDQGGEFVQLIAWTATYGGGAKLGQICPEPDQIGTLRLDAACSGVEACNTP